MFNNYEKPKEILSSIKDQQTVMLQHLINHKKQQKINMEKLTKLIKK